VTHCVKRKRDIHYILLAYNILSHICRPTFLYYWKLLLMLVRYCGVQMPQSFNVTLNDRVNALPRTIGRWYLWLILKALPILFQINAIGHGVKLYGTMNGENLRISDIRLDRVKKNTGYSVSRSRLGKGTAPPPAPTHTHIKSTAFSLYNLLGLKRSYCDV
jgi:hypothetical protein